MHRCDRRSYARHVICFALALPCVATTHGAQAQSPATDAVAGAGAPAVQAQVLCAGAPVAAGVVNINEASLEELQRLPGIGPARARAVVTLRERLRRFGRVEDLMRVRGIGRKTFRRLRPMLALRGETTLQPRARARCGRVPTAER